MPPERFEYRQPWSQRIGTLAPILVLPLMYVLLFPSLLRDYYEIRPAGVLAVVAVAGLLLSWMGGARTTVSAQGITCREVGRPWLLGRRTSVTWPEIAAVEPVRYGKVFRPLLHLTDGGVVWARLPAPRTEKELSAQLEEWRGLHPGLDLTVRRGLSAAGRNRRRMITATGVLALAVSAALLVTAFAQRGYRRPPDVLTCPLVPIEVVRQVVSQAVAPAHFGGAPIDVGDPCEWTPPKGPDGTPPPGSAQLSLAVHSNSADYQRESYGRDRLLDRARHFVHDVPGIRGYSWAALDNGAVKAAAQAVTGGYRIVVEVRMPAPLKPGETPPPAPVVVERHAAEVARTAARRLGGGS